MPDVAIVITADGAAAARSLRGVRQKLAEITGTCQAEIGPMPDDGLPPQESIRYANGCTEKATVTLVAGCVHEHIGRKRLCAEHGRTNPGNAVWLCGSCAEAGHECKLIPEVLPDTKPEATDG